MADGLREKSKNVSKDFKSTNKAAYIAHIVQVYHKMAKNYDRGEFLAIPLRKAAVKTAQVKQGDKVLDICTGTGEAAAWFAREGAKVIGIDLSPDMLTIARSKYPSITFKLMDASELNFSDKFFDVVNVQSGLHDMPVPVIKKTLREMRRVSRRTVIITEPYVPTDRLLKALVRYMNFSEFFEAADWKGYTNLDLRKEIQDSGMKIENETPFALGLFRIYKCR
ncbi:MAG: class I SAM-dependent methyltransferase [Promethearchaeota archaeon]